MKKSYYQPEDLKKFKAISDWNEALGEKFFSYYGEVFKEGHPKCKRKIPYSISCFSCSSLPILY